MTFNENEPNDNENVIPIEVFRLRWLHRVVNTPEALALKSHYPLGTWEYLAAVESPEGNCPYNDVEISHSTIGEIDPIKMLTLTAHLIASMRTSTMDIISGALEDGDPNNLWIAHAPDTPFDGSEEELDSEGEPIFDPDLLTNPEIRKTAKYTEAFNFAVDTIFYQLSHSYGDDMFKPTIAPSKT